MLNVSGKNYTNFKKRLLTEVFFFEPVFALLQNIGEEQKPLIF